MIYKNILNISNQIIGAYGSVFSNKKFKEIGLKYYRLACAKILEEIEDPSLIKVQALLILSGVSLCTYII